MKHFYSFCLLMMVIMASYAQAPVVSFACHDENNNPQRLDSVRIENWTRSWTVTIYYPNLTISLADVANGVTEVEFDDEGLARNIPNPFNGRTRAQLTLPNNEHIIMRVFDITGKAVAYYEGQFEAGKHDFDIVLSTPQTYILQVATSRKTYAIKMVNTGNGGENKINLLTSNNEVVLKSAKQIMDYDFEIGDCMHYQGFVTVGNEAVRTDPITQNQYESELITFVLHTQQTTTAPVGVYAGVVGFNNQLYVKPIDVLNNSTQNSFRNFINNLPMGNGTILYHADYTALNNIASALIPDELINVTLVTFTDGLDLGSWRMNPFFTSETEYLNAVHSRILNDELGGVHITAYAIGVKGSDVTDTARFRYDLRMLSSDPQHNVYEVADISEVNAQFREVAAQLNQSSIVTTDISLLLPAPDPGTRIRFTFDNVTSATSSYYYIEGTYNYNNGVGTLSNIVYEGLTSTSGNTVTGIAQGIFDRFVFTDVKDLLQQQLNTNNIKQWYFIPSTQQWQHNSEFTTSNSTSSQQVHNSAIAMLVLDCSSSLGSSGFSTMKSSANNFLDILRNTNTLSAPTVQTSAASTVTDVSATLNGSVTNSGNLIIHECGFVLSLSPNMSNATFYNASNTNSFNYTVTGLTPNTTYYYRAFARNNRGIGYGVTQSFTTPTLPAVTTGGVSNVTGYSASCGGTVTSTGNTTVTARGVCYSTSHNPTIADLHTNNGTGGGSFTSNMTGLNPGTTYYVRAYATNIVGTVYGSEVSFTTNVVLPEVTTTEITNNLGATATSGGNVTNAGGGTVTLRGICWSTSQNPTVSNSHTTNGSGMGSFTSNITGLSINTTYYVRAYATNSAGTAYGNQITFTTPNIPTVTTNTVNSITGTTASCGGNVTATGGVSVTVRGVCWSTSQNPTVSNSHTTNGSGIGNYTSNITGLSIGTTYYVRAYATNSAGTAYGNQLSFTTPDIPTVTTNTVSSITTTTASCGGNVTATGGANITARGVCWSTSQNPTVSDSHTTNGTGSGSFTSSITGLNPATTYYVRAYATNSAGTAYGTQRSFTTQATVPTVTTNNTINNITATTATCGGNVTNTGGASVTARGICWSTSAYPTVSGNHTTNGSGTGSFTSDMTGLTPGTTYYLRAYATNSVGTSYGEHRSFNTMVTVPTVTTNTVSNITSTSATCGGNVTSTGGVSVTARGVCWSTSPNPTVSDNHTTNGSGTGSFTSNISGLSPGTTYYVRAYATNSEGTSYGSQRTLTTLTVPTVTTNTVSSITTTTAACGGNVTATGGVTVTARGICWSTSQNPTINNSHTTNGTGTGSFTSNMTELSPGTTYYVRAYATNSVGSSYGEERSFTTEVTVPTVTTNTVSNVTSSSATCGGNVTSTGGVSVTARGVCWSTSPNPTVSDNHTTNGSGTGSFTSNLTGLTSGTTYYVRAYATNSVGTSYGSQRICTTRPTDSAPCGICTDYDNNTYSTVQIGNQCWMKENLRTTHYANGTSITLGSSTSTTTAYRYYPDNNSSNVGTYGYLYNWKAVMNTSSSSSSNPSGVQGICPNGWHVPSNSEWTQLTDYVGSQSQYQCNSSSANIAKALASIIGWNSSSETSCDVGYNSSSNNSTGFGALPAGCGGSDSYFGTYARYWSATNENSSYSYYWGLSYNSALQYQAGSYKFIRYSVRCLRNEGISVPIVTTPEVSQVSGGTAVSGGNISYDGGAPVAARGICWGTSPNPTVNNSHTTDGSGAGSYTSNITGLVSNTVYYVRAYATNSQGTSYGEQRVFTTHPACSGNPTVTDYDGNVYQTVQIGNQCWMKENLRTTRYANGTSIALGSSTSTTTAYRYYPDNNSSNVSTYGYLYNWAAVMNDAGSSAFNPSGVQGICPNGWHVPSDAEWTQLTDYVGSQSTYLCGNDSSYITKALVATIGWNISTVTCAAGNNLNVNNVTGFSALPAGYYHYNGNYSSFSNIADFWSSTENVEDKSFYINFHYNFAYINRDNFSKSGGFSVRCLRNDGISVPAVSSTMVSSITDNTATCGGKVISDGGDSVTVRGICWSTSQNPTVSNNHTTNGTGIGSFTSNISGLFPGTTYYVRAYATNSIGTNYGAQRSFTTLAVPPTVTTNTVSDITATTATCGGNVTATGGASVTARGVCWSISQNPTLSDSHTTNGTGSGSFTSNITGLSPVTTYYVRAYATNSAGTAYGTQQNFTTQPSVPTVTTNTISSITSTSVACGGNVIATGGATVTARGVCWSTSQNPTANGSHTTNGTGSGSFTSSITGLTNGTTYYVRAYATNREGTSYGEQRSFTTLNNHGQTCSGVATVTDIDNNTYNTVKIGNQCWMKENLRTTHYANGESIALGSSTSTTTAYRYNPNNNSSNVSTYGYLYNWAAVMHGASSSSANPSGRQGVCPNGWHVPSEAEWTQLENYVKSQSAYRCNSTSTNIAKALSSTTGWSSNTEVCAPGNTPANNNATGFGAQPEGRYTGSYSSFGHCSNFWSCTVSSSDNSNARAPLIYYDRAEIENYSYDKHYGFSVRCVKN